MSEAYLGVTKSLKGQRWMRRPCEARFAEQVASSHGIPLIAAEVMMGRGVAPDNAEGHLNPTLKADMPDPSSVKDMDKAAERLADAVIAKDCVAVFGDYDVDGATSSALFVRFFEAYGCRVIAHIPDRMREGYGPNVPAMQALARDGAKVIVTVDCGTLSYEPIKAGTEAGADVIIADHHKAEPILPDCYAVVNPNRLDDESDLGHLAAVGVTFMLLVATARALRARGVTSSHNLIGDLDLVALGTVADVVPLTGLNRTFVSQGLKVMRERRNIGLTALADVSRMQEAPTVYHLGFLLGPRLNAGGRVGEAGLGLKLLTSTNPAEARQIAERLDHFNAERRQIEQDVQEAATQQIEQRIGPGGRPDTLAFAAGEGWHPGVIGIVASRLKERFGVPSFVIGLADGLGKGSGRSVTGVDLGAAVIEAAQNDLLLNGGGHAMAAGLTVSADQLSDLEEFLKNHMRSDVEKAALEREFLLDGQLAPSGVTASLVDALEAVGPYGMGYPGPRFVLADVALVAADVVGADHVRLRVKGRDGTTLKAMAFRAAEEEMGQVLLTGVGRKFHLAGRLKKDDWAGGDKAEMHIEDAALIGPP